MNSILNGMEKNPSLGKNYKKILHQRPKLESKENTDQFSKDEILIEEKSILTQELILGVLRKMIFLWKIMINLSKMKSLVMKYSTY